MTATATIKSQLAEYRRTRDVCIRDRLVKHYMSWVERLAIRLCSRLPAEVQRDDLIQWGLIGLLQALNVFDPARGLSFTTFAARRVHGAMIDGLRDTSPVKRQALRRAKRIDLATDALRVELGRPPTRDEIRQRMKLSPKDFALVEATRAPLTCSLSQLIEERTDEGDQSKTSTMIDHRAGKDGVKIEARDIIGQMHADFSLTDTLVVRLYYLDGMSMQQVGSVLRITESAVSMRHKRVMARLRAKFREPALAA